MASCTDIITHAFTELGAVSAADVLSADDVALGLVKLNVILDNLNAEGCGAFSETFVTYTLTPNLSPHTIGPSGTFTAAVRPVTVDGANLILTNVSPAVYTPLVLRDRPWWLDQPVPTQTSSNPTDLYYEPFWPNGSLYLWPVPTVAYGLEIMTRGLLAQVTLVTTFTLPPGYQEAITLTLAESLAPSLLLPVSPQTAKRAQDARARIYANNDRTPRLSTRDAGMPSGASRDRGTYLNGWI